MRCGICASSRMQKPGVWCVSEADRARAAGAIVRLKDLEEGEREQRVRTRVSGRSCVRMFVVLEASQVGQ